MQLADCVHLDYSTLGHIERGRRGFSQESLNILADFFNVSADYLLGKSPEDMLHDFVASIPASFETDTKDSTGDVTHGYSKDVSPIMRNRFEIIKLLNGTDDADIIEVVHSFLQYFTNTAPTYADKPEEKELLNARLCFANQIIRLLPSLYLEDMETVYQTAELQYEKHKKEH